MSQTGFVDPSGKVWDIEHLPGYVFKDDASDAVSIKLKLDDTMDRMYSGIYHRIADLENGGIYQVCRLKIYFFLRIDTFFKIEIAYTFITYF